MAQAHFYWVLFAVSQTMLLTLLIIAIHQLYSNNPTNDQLRYNKISRIVMNISLFTIVNALLYLSVIYPNQWQYGLSIQSLFILSQGITIVIASHTFCVLIKSLITTIDNSTLSTPIQSSHWFKSFVNCIEFIGIISTLTLHAITIITNNNNWIILVYLIICLKILSLSIVVLILYRGSLKIYLKDTPTTSKGYPDVEKAIAKIRTAQCVASIFITLVLIALSMTLIRAIHLVQLHRKFEFELNTVIQISLIMCVASITFILWIHKPSARIKSICPCSNSLDDDDKNFKLEKSLKETTTKTQDLYPMKEICSGQVEGTPHFTITSMPETGGLILGISNDIVLGITFQSTLDDVQEEEIDTHDIRRSTMVSETAVTA